MASQEEKLSPLEEKVVTGIDLDNILKEEIGQFGRFQILILVLASLPIIFSSVASAEYIFTTGRLPTRCLIPECDGANPEFAPAWLGNAVPGGPGSYDDCNRFANLSAPADPVPPDTCPAQLFDRNRTLGCDEYVYERTNTVVYDFSLECDEWRRTLIGSIRTGGILISLPISGFISDRWGRRIALTFSAFNSAWIGILRAFVNSYEWYIVLQTLEASFSGSFTASFLIVSEFVGPQYRVIAGPLVSSLGATGFVINGLLAWAVQDWRHLTLTIFIPQLITIGYLWVMPESVRWFISKGRYTEAEALLKRAARVNGSELSENTLKTLQEAAKREKERTDKERDIVEEVSLFRQVWRSRVILFRCCITPIWWISTIMVYYGVSINAVSLAGNRFLNYIYVSAIEIPGYLTAMLVLDRVGRKPTLLVGFLVCSACQFAFAFISDDHQAVLLVVYLLGKYSISLVVTTIYIYTAELYPTKHRHSLFAFSSMIGRVGAIIAPLTPALMMYWVGIPSMMFGALTILSATLVLFMPETLGTKLPDTIEDAEILGKKNSSLS